MLKTGWLIAAQEVSVVGGKKKLEKFVGGKCGWVVFRLRAGPNGGTNTSKLQHSHHILTCGPDMIRDTTWTLGIELNH
jgi:hypothetical protein